MLCIDYRESKLIDLIKTSYNDYNYKVMNLILGDFIIKDEEDNIKFIIERKSINDLCASITDGRWSDQKQRLLESSDSSKIIFIIEGRKVQSKFSRIPVKTMNSAILNLIFKYNFHVIFTDNIEDTLENIILLYNKIKNDELKTGEIIVQPIKLIKKSDKNNENVFINQLGVITGVSMNTAIKIKEKYNCMYDLIEAFGKNKELLIDLPIGKRKLGKVLNAKIYNSLF